ncbi:MAG TPA: amino acid permease [Kofleriaceae bacterium]|nr:amino acid permease [Kofleriaceae bacterium]
MTPPRRQLGLTIAAAIVIANMIGTGVFTTAGYQAASLHDPKTILLSWIVGGLLALCGAAAYAELGAMMPRAGGEYVYLREAYHPALGFMSGWVSLTAGFSAPIAVSALAFASYAGTLFPALAPHAPWLQLSITIAGRDLADVTFGAQQAVAVALIVAITALHSFDTKLGGWVQAAFTAAKVLLIAGFIGAGLLVGHGHWSHLAGHRGGLSNLGTGEFAAALMTVSFAYSGWNAAAYVAGEIARPAKTLPRALFLGTGLVMALYVSLNLVFLYAVPSDVLAGAGGSGPVLEVGDLAARALFGDTAGRLVTAVIALALVSAVSAMVMAGPRVYAAMARDRALPRPLARFSSRGVPTVSVIAQGALGCMFAVVGDPDVLIRFVGFTLAIFAALTVGALFVLRARGLRAPYQTIGYPVTPLAFIALSAWIAFAQISERPRESLVIGLVLSIGGLLYIAFSRGTSAPPAPDASVLEREPT